MPLELAAGTTVVNEVTLGVGLVRTSPSALKIDVGGFKFDIGGFRGTYDGAVAQSVTDNDTSYVYLDSVGALQINTTGFPSLAHIPLARVVAASGEVTAIHEERVLLASSSSSQGTVRLTYPVDGDIRGGDTGASSNNNWAAITYAGSGAAGEARNRWIRRPPQNYVSGDLVLRVYYSHASSPGGGNKKSFWRISYKFASLSEALGTMDSATIQNDHAGQNNDELLSFDLTIPEADVDITKDLMALYLAREYDDAQDTYSGDLYIHNIELRYTGILLSGQPGQ